MVDPFASAVGAAFAWAVFGARGEDPFGSVVPAASQSGFLALRVKTRSGTSSWAAYAD
ncbi:MAG: hypothetical protein AAF752_04015 [Bacteroidota bacterium]